MTLLKAEIEDIFNESNIDEDCETIASLLSPYRKAVRELLSQGNFVKAVTVMLEIGKVGTDRGIRGLWCAVYVKCMGEV